MGNRRRSSTIALSAAALPLALLGLATPAAEGRPGGVCADGSPKRAAAAGEVAVLAFDEGLAEEQKAAAWLPHRIADLIVEDLSLLGLEVRDHRLNVEPAAAERGDAARSAKPAAAERGAKPAAAERGTKPAAAERGDAARRWTPERVKSANLALLATGRSSPPLPDSTDKITLELSIVTADRELERVTTTGSAEQIDELAAKAAIAIADALGDRPSPAARARLSARRRPFVLHRLLGEARLELDRGDPRKARLKFDRAAELVPHAIVPEALEGAQMAQAALAGRKRQGEQADLAASALERAEGALRAKNKKELIQGFSSFLRYTSDRALHWVVRAPLERGRSEVIAGDDYWLLATERRLWRIDPIAGTLTGPEAPSLALLASVGDQRVTFEGKHLERRGPSGPPRWRLKAPFAPKLFLPSGGAAVAGGLLPIIGPREVAWVDIGIGALTQTAQGVGPRAQGDDGVVVAIGAELALLRPGKKTPAWKTPIAEAPSEIAMSPGRVVLIGKSGLSILDAVTGKIRLSNYALGPAPRWLGAGARYGAIAHDDGAIWIHDVLGGERTAIVRGPGRAVAALGTSSGVAIVFDTGDVLGFDRDGVLLERTRVDGVPFAVLRGSALAPGTVVLSTRGLWAFGEPPDPSAVRDVEAMLRLAEALSELGEKESALELIEHALMRGLGRVERLEAARAKLLDAMKDTAGAAEARRRAAEAKDPLKPLQKFRL